MEAPVAGYGQVLRSTCANISENQAGSAEADDGAANGKRPATAARAAARAAAAPRAATASTARAASTAAFDAAATG